MPNSYAEILTARGGSFILNDTDGFTGSFVYAIVTLEDTVFSTIESKDSNGIVATVTDDHIADPTVAVKAGAIITPMNINKPFFTIEIASGSVALILK